MIRKIRTTDYKQMALLTRQFIDENARSARSSKIQSIYMDYKDLDKEVLRISKHICKLDSLNSHYVFVYEKNHEIQGYIYGKVKNEAVKNISKIGVVEEWFVTKNHRGEHIGKLLWNKLIRIFKLRNIKLIKVSVYSNNHKVKRLYQSLGFIPLDITMLKRLN